MKNRQKRDAPHPFGAVLVRVRSDRGISQYKVAKAGGRQTSQVRQLERGKTAPEIDTIIWLSEALGMEPLELFGELLAALKEEEVRGSTARENEEGARVRKRAKV